MKTDVVPLPNTVICEKIEQKCGTLVMAPSSKQRMGRVVASGINSIKVGDVVIHSENDLPIVSLPSEGRGVLYRVRYDNISGALAGRVLKLLPGRVLVRKTAPDKLESSLLEVVETRKFANTSECAYGIVCGQAIGPNDPNLHEGDQIVWSWPRMKHHIAELQAGCNTYYVILARWVVAFLVDSDEGAKRAVEVV